MKNLTVSVGGRDFDLSVSKSGKFASCYISSSYFDFGRSIAAQLLEEIDRKVGIKTWQVISAPNNSSTILVETAGLARN